MKIRVAIIYPTDPLGEIPGGTDTCIRDILRFSPEDINIRLIGVTTDPVNRPVGKTTQCQIGNNSFEFLPLLSFHSLKKQMRIPLSVRFTIALIGKNISQDADILQFHRIEPAFLYLTRKKPKVFVIHQNMNILNNKNSDIRWKYLPKAYFALEDIAMPRADRTYVVREDGVADYKARYPEIQERFDFLPTWMNPNLFFPAPEDKRLHDKAVLMGKYNWDTHDPLIISVGRLDQQKDPKLQLQSFSELKKHQPDARMLMVGDGVLRNEVESLIDELSIRESVVILGVLGQDDVAALLRTADLMVLSSAYEGMPRCVVEALGCGLPVATTNVGEVPRIVKEDINGHIIDERTPVALSSAMSKIIANRDDYAGQNCTKAVDDYTAPVILSKVFDEYRRLHSVSNSK